MKRRVYLSIAAAGLGGCLERNFRESSGGADRRPSNTSSTVDSSTGSDESPDCDEPRVRGDPFDDFSDLSRWDVRDGSLAAADGRGSNGRSGAILRAGSDDDRAMISRSLAEPLDCSAVGPGLTVAANDPAVPTIQLFDTDGNRADFRRGLKGNRPPLRHAFGLTAVAGPIDLSAVTRIRIAQWAGDRSHALGIDELFFVPRSSTGTVTIQFDDGYATDYTEALPILDRYGYPAVSFVNPVTIGDDGRLTVPRCSELRDAGWTIANHTHSHRRLEELSGAEQAAEIVRGKEWLLDHGFDRGARYFAYPFGQWDERTLEIVEKHHDLAFWSGRGVTGDVANPLLCPRVGEPTADTATELLDRAAACGGHVTLFYHELYGDQLTDFERTVEHLHALESTGRVDVVTPADLESDSGT